MQRSGSAPPTKREIQRIIRRRAVATNGAWYAYLDEVFATDPALCVMRAQNADLTSRVDEMKREFFAARGFTIRPRNSRSPRAISSTARRARTTTRTRERRERHVARSTSSADSGDSDEPEPPEGRFCGGCGRDISHRRADAKTCGKTCSKRVERGRGIDALLEQRRETWHDAAVYGGCHDLTFQIDCDRLELYEEIRDAQRADVAIEREFDAHDALMRSNGVYVRRRPIAREWRTRITSSGPAVVIA